MNTAPETSYAEPRRHGEKDNATIVGEGPIDDRNADSRFGRMFPRPRNRP